MFEHQTNHLLSFSTGAAYIAEFPQTIGGTLQCSDLSAAARCLTRSCPRPCMLYVVDLDLDLGGGLTRGRSCDRDFPLG